ncbi:hypothetical protein [Crossiella cryophila]|uniref:Uncharacterized protein n=1 Tax=Crossiella cryophila TaxID=43355 RepID=A0A7W7CA71_9PSEU|nr:hypothetical protein [Crossiella cryophila]MBB4677412.1 hypothetical protein [Crossiella cryophila]
MTDRPRRIEVGDSGMASASSGGYANTGVHIGDVNLLTGVPVRTNYRHQVRRIAPPQLLDRERELAELAEFCTSPATAGRYRWWQAGAWSGKTALLSWFTLNPPPGVRVISFFITARLAGQNNRAAFLDNLLEQLLALLGETVPPFLTEHTREPHLLSRLEHAAQLCQDRGEQLILLVDGLDEDRGVTTGPDAHSIAALLPDPPPAGMRVLVAGRPNPPVPADVPQHHPLHAKDIVRPLAPSRAAKAIRREMERDLHCLLNGTPLEQDLLGLLTAAGGGLTKFDLAELTELTDCSPWEVASHLNTVTGRSFARRDSHYQPEQSPEVFLLGHEDIQLTAQDMLGPARLAAYRERLHGWAEGYRERGWPVGTPEYLVRGYHTMLTALGDLVRLTALVTDPGRQERMHEYSGSDSNALAEIVSVLAGQVERAQPDLTAITRLAVHRDHLNDRHSDIPPEMPAAWAMVGQVSRAEALLQFLTPAHARLDGVLALVEIVADPALLVEATPLAKGHKDLLRLAAAHARIGDLDRAAALMDQVEGQAADAAPEDRSEILLDLALTRFRLGETESAIETITGVKSAPALPGPVDRAAQLIGIANVRVRMGEVAMARTLAGEAERLLRSVPDRDEPALLDSLAKVLARCGDLQHAETVARAITNPYTRDNALRAVARASDPHRSAAIIRSIADQATKVSTMALVTADLDRLQALVWLAEADTLTQVIEDAYDRGLARADITTALIRIGELGHAEASARAIEDPRTHATALIAVATAHARTGTVDRAFTLVHDAYSYVRTYGDRVRVAETLLATAQACIRVGDHSRAVRLLSEAEPWARGSDNGAGRGHLLCLLADALLDAGAFDQAKTLADTVPEDWRDVAATYLTEHLSDSGDLAQAERIARAIPTHRARYWALLTVADAGAAALIDEVEAHADEEDDLLWREELLARMAESMAGHDELVDRAVTTARSLTMTHLRFAALASAALGHARLGQDRDSATLLDEVEDIAQQATLELRENSQVVPEVIAGLARIGDFDRAERLISALPDGLHRSMALSECVRELATRGDLGRAERLTGDITVLDSRVRSLLVLAQADPARRDSLIDEAEQVAGTTGNPDFQAGMLIDIAAHAPERATRLIARAIQLHDLDNAVGELVRVQPTAIDTIEQELAVVSGD